MMKESNSNTSPVLLDLSILNMKNEQHYVEFSLS